jgi:hypothetical protein
VLETGDLGDLTRLRTFVASLRDRSSERSSLQRLCATFEPLLHVAERYVEIRAESSTNIASVDNMHGRWTVQARPNSNINVAAQHMGHAGSTTMDLASGNWFDGTEEFMTDDPTMSTWLQDCQQTLQMLQQDDLFLAGTTLL